MAEHILGAPQPEEPPKTKPQITLTIGLFEGDEVRVDIKSSVPVKRNDIIMMLEVAKLDLYHEAMAQAAQAQIQAMRKRPFNPPPGMSASNLRKP